MLEVGGVPILASVYDILVTLRRELKLQGISYLRDIKKTGGEIRVTCPYHSNGMETNPDMCISTYDKRKSNSIVKAGTCYCFACKTTVGLPDLINKCFGQSGSFGENWILERFVQVNGEDRSKMFNIPKREIPKPEELNYIEEEELQQYYKYHPYITQRYLDSFLVEFFDIGYDENFNPPSLTFPIRDSNGRIMFIARRSVEGKRFSIPKGAHKTLPYAYESFKLLPEATELYICESLFNALTLIKWGKPSIALLGTGSKEQIQMLKLLHYRKYVLALDNDSAGTHGKKVLYENLKDYKLIGDLTVKEHGKDINDYGFCENFEEFLNYAEVN